MIAAIILAAGRSQRMGRPKLALPWGKTTVIGQVTTILLNAGAGPVVVVTGGSHDLVAEALVNLPVRLVFNPRFAEDQMIYTLQVGLASLGEDVEATLVALGDQPQIEEDVVRAVMAAYHQGRAALVAPSYRMRRGHPWLVDRALWPELLALQSPYTLRDFLTAHAGEIRYLDVDTDSILQDLDTPEDYTQQKPK